MIHARQHKIMLFNNCPNLGRWMKPSSPLHMRNACLTAGFTCIFGNRFTIHVSTSAPLISPLPFSSSVFHAACSVSLWACTSAQRFSSQSTRAAPNLAGSLKLSCSGEIDERCIAATASAGNAASSCCFESVTMLGVGSSRGLSIIRAVLMLLMADSAPPAGTLTSRNDPAVFLACAASKALTRFTSKGLFFFSAVTR